MFFDVSKINDMDVQNILAVHLICLHKVSDLASWTRGNPMAMHKIICKQQQPNQFKALSRSYHAAGYFSTTHLSCPKKGPATEAPHLSGLTKPTNLSHIPCMSKSSDTSPKPSHYLAVKFAGGKVIHCELKPLLNFHEDDFSKKLEKGWCVLCDLRPLEKKVEGKLVGAVEWDGERLTSILKEHLDSVKFLQQELHLIGEREEEVVREVEELRQLEQQRLEMEEAAEKKVNFLEWVLLGGLAVIMGVFIRYVICVTIDSDRIYSIFTIMVVSD